MSTDTCPNCGVQMGAYFCPNCGQARVQGRITLGHMLQQLWQEAISIESPFFRTIIALSYRPGFAIRDYLAGKRKAYYRPVQYFLICMGLYLLAKSWYNFDPIRASIRAGYLQSNAANNPINVFIARYINHFALLQVLILALVLQVAYWRPRLHWGEALVVAFYITGQYIFLYVLLIPLILWFPQLVRYVFWVYVLLTTLSLVGLRWPSPWWQYPKALLVAFITFWLYALGVYALAAWLLHLLS